MPLFRPTVPANRNPILTWTTITLYHYQPIPDNLVQTVDSNSTYIHPSFPRCHIQFWTLQPSFHTYPCVSSQTGYRLTALLRNAMQKMWCDPTKTNQHKSICRRLLPFSVPPNIYLLPRSANYSVIWRNSLWLTKAIGKLVFVSSFLSSTARDRTRTKPTPNTDELHPK